MSLVMRVIVSSVRLWYSDVYRYPVAKLAL